MPTRTQACPQCQKELTLDIAWPPWCQTCDWGVDPSPEERSDESTVSSWWRKWLNHMSAREHERLLSEGLTSRRSGDAVVVWALATGVHLVTALLVVAVVLLVISPLLWFFKIFFCMALLGIIWYASPRPPARPTDAFELEATEAPAMHGLLAEVAKQVGVRPPERVYVDPGVNASWRTCGWKKRALVIGLPLWAVLDTQEKVALLGHELGHEASHDPRRRFYVWSAVGTLQGWGDLLWSGMQDLRAGRGGIHVVIGRWLMILALFPVLILLGLLGLVLATMSLRSSQRAEHVADRIGARVAGRSGALGLAHALLRVRSLAFALEVRSRQNPESDAWLASREHYDSVPEHEIARLTRLAEVTLQSVDASHPPTARRLELLAQAPDVPAMVLISPAQEEAVDAEIRRASPWVARRLRDMAWHG